MKIIELLKTGNEQEIVDKLYDRLCLMVAPKESICCNIKENIEENAFRATYCKKCIKKWLNEEVPI